MSRIHKIPTGSTVETELKRGKIYTRTGKRGQATILFDKQDRQFVVLAGKNGGQRQFTSFSQALRTFRMIAGV